MIYNLIPAKVKSSRLPGKNTFGFMLGDKPLICHTVGAVRDAGLRPIVFTDEQLPSDIYYAARIVVRGADVSDLTTTMNETVKAFIDTLGISKDDTIVLTYLTCPFRTGKHIKQALSLFKRTRARSLQSLTPVDYRPYGLMKQTGKHKFKCLQDQKDYYRQQNTPTLYKANGAIYIFKVSELQKLNRQMFNDNTIGYVLDDVAGLDIDTEHDLMIAKTILSGGRNESAAYKLPCPGEFKTEYSADRTGHNSICFEIEWA